MITRVTLRHFKCFEEEHFDLDQCVALAGPNNAGKSTLLQAIMAWKLGVDACLRKGSARGKRTRVPIGRFEFTPLPLREMNLLWTGRVVSKGRRGTSARKIEIAVEGANGREPWAYGVEFQYSNSETLYVRPLGWPERASVESWAVPPQAAALQVAHVPALASVEPTETRYDPGYQLKLVGEGKAGSILRNLLLEIAQVPDDWAALAAHVQKLFSVELLRPEYAPAQPAIVVEYRHRGGRPLDLTCAGSGMLQVLLILSFFYARPASVLLMDEPDAHLHVILQEQVYDLLRRIAYERGSQLIVATHSEVLLDATSPDHVLAFIGEHPHRLSERWERNGLREAIKRLTTTDLVFARETGAVLYVEDESDARILREWAAILSHPALAFLEEPYVHVLHGRSLPEARSHFFALKAAHAGIRGVCLLDGDDRGEPDDETTRAGLRVLRWRRYEIENYLVVPEALTRFCRHGEPELFAPVAQQAAEEFLRQQLPPAVVADPLSDHQFLRVVKASDNLLVPLFQKAGKPMAKKDLYLVAAAMRSVEVHPEVAEKLDLIAEALLPSPGSES